MFSKDWELNLDALEVGSLPHTASHLVFMASYPPSIVHRRWHIRPPTAELRLAVLLEDAAHQGELLHPK